MSNATQSQQYREVSRKANAGERIKIVAAVLSGGRYNNGDELVVDSVESSGVRAITSKSERAGIFHREYVVLEPVVAPAPLTASLPDLFAQFIRDNAGAVRSYLAEIDPVDSVEESASEPPLTRAKVIEMARERVAELERIGTNPSVGLPQGPFEVMFYNVEFHVNREKRTVTALVREGRRRQGSKPAAVGIAKAAPDDVFNADIGKAIAAERALGLTLTDAFVNAPKPTDIVAGMFVKYPTGRVAKTVNTSQSLRGSITRLSTARLCSAVILNDTDAVYTQEEREAA